MPSKKKKYNARFPAGRIKKIMQTDEEVGKVAQAVPVIISRTLELFVESLLTKSMHITLSRNAKTLTPSHMKQCILSESRFDFLKDLVKNVPDASTQEDNENNALFEAGPEPETSTSIAPPTTSVTITTPGASTSRREKRKERLSSNMGSSSKQPEFSIETYPPQIERQPVIQFVPKQSKEEPPKLSFSVSSMLPDVASSSSSGSESNLQIRIDASSSGHLSNINSSIRDVIASNSSSTNQIPVPPLVPLSNTFYNSNTSDTLCIDEDYDN